MLRDMGLTDEELEEARRQALEGMVGEAPLPAPVPGGSGNRSVEVVPVPTLGAEPGTTKQQTAFDSELEAARGQDRGALFGQNLAQGLHDFNAKYLSGGQPMKAFGAGASAEGQLLADRSAKGAKEKAEYERLRTKALDELARSQFGETVRKNKADEADKVGDNARFDRQLGEVERHNRAMEGVGAQKVDAKAAGAAAKKAEAAEAEAGAAESAQIPYLNTTLKPLSVPTEKKAREAFFQGVAKLRAQAANNGSVVSALKEMEQLIDEVVKDPTNREKRARAQSQAGLIAPRINVAQGQGAMAEGEYSRVKQSIGDIGSAGFWIDALTRQDDAALLNRARQAQKYFVNDMQQAAKAYRYGR